MQVAFVSVIGFCALWGLVFFFSLLLVPGKLDAERAKEIHERIAANEELGRQIGILQQEIKKDPVQEHLESQARNALDKMQPHQREFIRWLLDQPEIAETETMNMCPAGLHPHAIREGITEGKKHGLVAVRLGTSPLSPGGERFASINPRFVDALTHIFHIQPVTPTQV